MEKEIKFEKAMGRLEEIVQGLEKGDLSLEDSLKIFEEGIRLSQVCMAKLDEAEKKVEILMKEKGKTVFKPFLPEAAGDEDKDKRSED